MFGSRGGTLPLADEEEGDPAAAPLVGAEGGGSSRSHRRGPQRQRSEGVGAVAYEGLTAAQLRQVVREHAAGRARSRLRFAVFREHLEVDSWYEVRFGG